jgi:hypothetical protein
MWKPFDEDRTNIDVGKNMRVNILIISDVIFKFLGFRFFFFFGWGGGGGGGVL